MSTPENTQPTTPLQPLQQTQQTTPLPPQQYAPAPPQQQQYAPAPQPAPAPIPVGTTVGETNTFALLSIILAFIMPLAAIIFGHMGLSQIKRTGDAGRGIALTGTIIGYAYFAFIALFIIFYIGMLVMMFGAMGAAFSDMGSYGYDDFGTEYDYGY